MDRPKKHKSGFEKRKDKEKRKLEEAQNNQKQAKLGRFFVTSRSDASTHQEEAIDIHVEEQPTSIHKSFVTDDQAESAIDEGFLVENIYNASVQLQVSQPVNPASSFIAETENQISDKPESDVLIETREKPLTILPPFKNDKGLYDSCRLFNSEEIRVLLLAGPCQPKKSDMPDGEFKKSKDNRCFNSSYYYPNKTKPFMNDNCSPWLSYSLTKNYAYCHFCWLFGDEITKRSIWCTGFSDWKHFYVSSTIHGQSKAHLNNAVAASAFLHKFDICHQLDKQISEEAKKWRSILNIILDTVRTLSGLGVAFRGHRENLKEDENPGIYLSIINLISRHNPILHAHMESSERIKYLSKTITFELLDILANETCQAIINECKDAKFFSLIADSTTDVAHLDQMAILIRYVMIQNMDSTSPKVCIKESFLCFVRLKNGDATSICNEITAVLFDKYNFKKKYLCGQSYDGAPVMSGETGGVQKKMKNYVGDESFIPYIHCTAHQMTLVLIHAIEKNSSPSIKVFFATIESIYKYFSQSHRRWDAILEESQGQSRNSSDFGIQLLRELRKEIFGSNVQSGEDEVDEQGCEEAMAKERILHIKGLSTTRWPSRLKAVEAIIQNFECITNCIEDEISRVGATGEDIMNARSLLSSMNWLFFLNILWWHSVLSIINSVQVQLQKKELDLFMAQRCISTAYEKLKDLRNENIYNNFVMKAKNKWEEMGWENADFPVVRKRKIKKMFDEKAADTCLDTHEKHRMSYYEVLDTMSHELKERSNGFREINDVFGFLMPENLRNLEEDHLEASVNVMIKKYPEFFTADLKFELISFTDMYFSRNQDFSNDTPLQYLEFVIGNNIMDSFPECCSLFRLFLTLPISSASAERVMSSLKIVKEYRRASLAEDTLNNFCILYIERSMANSLNLDSAIEVFAEKKARRGFKTT